MEEQVNMHRYEIKYFIDKRQAAELRLFLRDNMELDAHAGANGAYWIRSMYFDTAGNNDYLEKMIGYNIRKKIRLRIYDTASNTAKLEIKNKYGNYIRKETTNILREDAEKLILGDSYPLLRYDTHAANRVFAFMHQDLYQPKVIIDYEREAYLYPFQNIRITLDQNLYANIGTIELYKKDIWLIPILHDERSILEIKYDHMLPAFLQRVLSSYITQKSQISKYCLGRNRFGN